MTRTEHLAWCKERALEYVDNNDLKQAFNSIMSDLGKHPETQSHMGIEMGLLMRMRGKLNSLEQMREFINGFN